MLARTANITMGAPTGVLPGPGTTANPVATAALQRVEAPLEVRVLDDALGADLSAASGIASAHGVRVSATSTTTSARDAIARLDAPVDTAASRTASDRLADIRTVLADPTLPPGTRAYLQHKARGIENLLELIRRQEDKERLVKKLLRELMAGALTPQTVRMAKALGLSRLVKDLIREMVAAGKLDLRSVAQVAAVMLQAGLPMPDLESLVIRQQKVLQRQVSESREARGLDPSGSAVSGALTGTQLLASAGSALGR